MDPKYSVNASPISSPSNSPRTVASSPSVYESAEDCGAPLPSVCLLPRRPIHPSTQDMHLHLPDTEPTPPRIAQLTPLDKHVESGESSSDELVNVKGVKVGTGVTLTTISLSGFGVHAREVNVGSEEVESKSESVVDKVEIDQGSSDSEDKCSDVVEGVSDGCNLTGEDEKSEDDESGSDFLFPPKIPAKESVGGPPGKEDEGEDEGQPSGREDEGQQSGKEGGGHDVVAELKKLVEDIDVRNVESNAGNVESNVGNVESDAGNVVNESDVGNAEPQPQSQSQSQSQPEPITRTTHQSQPITHTTQQSNNLQQYTQDFFSTQPFSPLSPSAFQPNIYQTPYQPFTPSSLFPHWSTLPAPPPPMLQQHQQFISYQHYQHPRVIDVGPCNLLPRQALPRQAQDQHRQAQDQPRSVQDQPRSAQSQNPRETHPQIQPPDDNQTQQPDDNPRSPDPRSAEKSSSRGSDKTGS